MNVEKTATRGDRNGTVDWEGIHRQLEAMRTAAEHGWAPGPEEARKILKARAQALARTPQGGGLRVHRAAMQDVARAIRAMRGRAITQHRPTQLQHGAAAGESLEILEFRLAYESYAIEACFVREVCPLKDFTPVPCTPPFVLGIVNVRGQILSVIDLKKFFELPEKGLSDLNKVIVAHNRDIEFGILADAVAGVRAIPVADIQAPLPTLTGIRQDYLKGVTRDRLVVLDGAKLLSDSRMKVEREPGARAGGS